MVRFPWVRCEIYTREAAHLSSTEKFPVAAVVPAPAPLTGALSVECDEGHSLWVHGIIGLPRFGAT